MSNQTAFDFNAPAPAGSGILEQVFAAEKNLRPNPEANIRSGLADALSSESLYDLPEQTRRGMTNFLLVNSGNRIDGRHYPSVAIQISESLRKTRTPATKELSSEHDLAWSRHMREDPSVLNDAIIDATQSLTEAGATLLEMEDGYELGIQKRPGEPQFFIKSIGGVDLGAPSITDLAAKLKAMPDDQLEKAWLAVRVIREDCKPENIYPAIHEALVSARSEFEIEQEVEATNEIDFNDQAMF